MKKLKSLLPFLLMLFALVGCKTDDLEKDIDNLKDRVANLEAQVSLLNENLNAIRVILDASTTILEYSVDEQGNYTLKLSNGETISLNQGSEGQIVMPEISINEKGEWVLNGQVIGQATGNQGMTPKFNISADKYWQVSYDDGATYEYVLDASGNRVPATTDGNVNVSDAFFKDVQVEGDMLVVTLHDGQKYSLPIVADLVAEIVDPTEGYSNDVWTLGYNTVATTEVKITGENYFVTVPAGGWSASLSEVKDGKAVLTVTAPAMAAASRATADNSTELVLQVNKGVNWAIDKIKVQAKDVVASYKALYDAGQVLTIGGQEISKEKFGEATLVDNADFDFKDNGVYFIDPSVTVNWTSTVNFKTLVLIGNNSSVKSKIAASKQMKVSDADDNNGFLFCANLEIDATNVTGDKGTTYLLAQNGNSAYKFAKFYDCDFTIPSAQPLTYISTSTRSFAELCFENCAFGLPAGTQQQYLISLGSSTAIYQKMVFKNNVFYSKTASQLLTKFKLFNGTKAGITNFVLEHNTFVNVATETSFMVYTNTLSDAVVQYNLFYFDADLDTNGGIFRLLDSQKPSGSVCDKNIVYRTDTNNWQAFYGGIKNGFDGAQEIERISANPFEGGTFDLASGTFVPNATYAEYGAKFE